MGTNLMADRVQARLDALGINQFEAERRGGFKRGYLYDLLKGNKKKVRQLDKIAAILECDPEYLRGSQLEPRRVSRAKTTRMNGSTQVPVLGVCELNVWRAPDAGPPAAYVDVDPDPRFPPDQQGAYLIRDNHAAEIGITERMIAQVVDPATLPGGMQSLKSGDVVVVKRLGRTGNLEFTIRILEMRLSGSVLRLPSAGGSTIPWPSSSTSQPIEIVGLVVRTVLLFRDDV